MSPYRYVIEITVQSTKSGGANSGMAMRDTTLGAVPSRSPR